MRRRASRLNLLTEKVRDTEWGKEHGRSWAKYTAKKLTTSAESHLLYHYGRTLGPGNYADVGVYRGASAAAIGHGLYDSRTNGTVYAVDLYEEPGVSINSCDNADVPTRLVNHFSEHIPTVGLAVCIGDSAEHGWNIQLPFRFVFLDADHHYEALKADVAAWGRLVEVGGVLAFHDVDFDSVHQVIQELPSEWKLERHVYSTKAFRRVSHG
jgi:predicted O-methyltransferase YrrM